ncbi:MAG: ThiF family adenylyltransferase [Acidobacteria bacterium]|nr:ThiF family adenylyltransferase [Acidobacteriota bacterium]
MDEDRYSRNVALFGEEGQHKIAATTVAIVGLGGLGSHAAQQLAYLGVVRYGLIDPDVITGSSLNRVVGALPHDVGSKTPKVRSAQRLIKSVQPEANVDILMGRVTRSFEDAAAAMIRESDVVFGCLDQELPRLFLTDLCSTFRTAYFDLATDTGGEDENWFGGRVVYCDGTRCLSCLDLLDQRSIRLEQMTEPELENERRLYGLGGNLLGGTGPAVVSVNGVVASMAVTEFMVHVTGMRQAAPQLVYRGDIPRVTLSKDVPRDGCPYCSKWRTS